MRRIVLFAALLAAVPAVARAQLSLGQVPLGQTSPGAGSGVDMLPDASNATAGTAKDNLQLVRDLKKDFGAACDGTTDDVAAFTAASTWLATGPTNRLVTIPAATCATSASVTVGNGRQQSTTLTGAASGTSISVASCSGVQNGDAVAIKRDDGTTFSGVTASSCVGTTLTISGAYSGSAASSGNVVFTGAVSTYNGGGFVGYGGCIANGTSNPALVSQIKYIGTASPSTTLGANATIGATSLTVASISNINIGDAIGVTLDDASVFWTWVTATPTGTTVKIGDEIPSLGTSGNTVLLEGNPVARINGPIFGPMFQGICLNANSTQAVGLDVRHSNRGRYYDRGGVSSEKYTGVGIYIHAGEFYAGASTGSGDNEYELHTISPQNSKTIGCWVRGTPGQLVASSRNRFYGGTCTSGGNDVRAAGLLMELVDNSTFYKPYTPHNGAFTAGAGLYRQPSINVANFPSENAYFSPAFIGGVTDGTATGGTLGAETMPSYSIYDSEGIPNSTTVSGYASSGTPFGRSVPREFFGGLKVARASATQVSISPGWAADSTGNTAISLTSTCTGSLNTSGNQGIDVGSKAPSTWYAVFVTFNAIAGTGSCLFSATTAAAVPTPTLPANYTYYAYVGRFKTDGSSNVTSGTVLPRGQFYVDASDTYSPGASGFTPRAVRLLACGGGGGGGSGGVQVSGTAVSGGSGGSGGGCFDITYPFEDLATSISVTVGGGGAAVSAPAGPNAAGTVGNAGNPTFFGASAATAIAYGAGGCAGDGGRLNAAAASGGGGVGQKNTNGGITLCTNGSGGTGGAAPLGGAAAIGAVGTTTTGAVSTFYGAGASGAGALATGAAGVAGGFAGAPYSCAGGASGGGITSAPAATNGGAGGGSIVNGLPRINGGTSGGATGGSGTVGSVSLPGSAAGGGYGDTDASPGSGAGGTGGQCAGGGGGGSTLNTFAAGGGGKGGDGYAFVWELR